MGPSMVSVDDLVRLTGASAITIRRDLADLEGQGLLRRVHGGAVAGTSRGARMPYALRSSEDLEAKEALGAITADLIADDSAVILDNGTTVDAVARHLAGRPLTALCMSLHAATPLAMASGAQVIVPGGMLLPQALAASPAASIAAINEMHADAAVLGACAVSAAAGLTTTTWDDAQIKKAIVGKSARRILVGTGRKLTRTSSFRFADLGEIDDLVTTDDVPEELLDDFRSAGVAVHVAPLRG